MAGKLTGLPKAPVQPNKSALESARFCESCGKEGRVLFNRSGIHVHCAACNKWWPVSSTPVRSDIPVQPPRGLTKQTYIEPDWSMAFDTGADIANENFGPKKK